MPQDCTAFFVGLRGGHHGDVHTTHAVDRVLIDFVEHGLLGQTEGVVTVTVELAVREAAEVADSGQCQG